MARSAFATAATVVGLALLPHEVAAQTDSDWRTVRAEHTWLTLAVDRPITDRVAFLGDLSWRRTGLGDKPQQLLTRGSVTYRLRPGLRLGAGINRVATATYGELPLPYPTRERQAFALLQLNQKAGDFDIMHRFRLEARWIADVRTSANGDNYLSKARYSRRVRSLQRFSHPVPALSLRGKAPLAIVQNELFVGLSSVDRGVSVDQNRFSVGAGIPLSSTYRVDALWMQQWIAVPRLRASENNGTLVMLLNYAPPAKTRR